MLTSPLTSLQNAASNVVDLDLRSDEATHYAAHSANDRAADPVRSEPSGHDASIVAVNASGIGYPKNASTIKVRPGTSQTLLSIHASGIAQLCTSDTRHDCNNLTYASGQLPTKANYKIMLI